MKAEFLSDEKMAEYFLQAGNTVQPDASPVDLEPRIEAWLSRANMAHRNALRIAIEVVKRAKPAPLPTPEQAARQHDQAQGVGDPRPLSADDLQAARISAMGMREWSQERQRLGLAKSTADHLSGV